MAVRHRPGIPGIRITRWTNQDTHHEEDTMPHDHWPGPPHPRPPGLEKHLRWLVSIGATQALDCTCPHTYKSHGRLHGISMGMGWVRLTTAPDCPDHGAPQ